MMKTWVNATIVGVWVVVLVSAVYIAWTIHPQPDQKIDFRNHGTR